jgi:tRNA(Ser,Leu) C12 N-acetylase TAN1
MQDWNVVVTVHDEGFNKARRLLEVMGVVSRTEFFNVLVMRVDDIPQLLESLRDRVEVVPGIFNYIARVVPATHTFNFQSPETFEEKAWEIVARWAQVLGNKGFHVRMRRRGFKGRLSSMDEERFLDEFLLGVLERAGTPGHINFADPDYIISVETLGTRAGFSLWSREELQRYQFLKID